jgi:hypothetical protein
MQTKTGQVMQVYKCRYADHWHIGRVRERMANGMTFIKKAEAK